MSGIKPHLLDVNFLVALAWPNHVAHARAVSWFIENQKIPFATCPITEAGFVRISLNPKIVTEQVSLAVALKMLDSYCNKYPHVFWPCYLDIMTALTPFSAVSGHRQITDAYLLALAQAHDGRLVTFDSGLATIAPPPYQEHLLVLEF